MRDLCELKKLLISYVEQLEEENLIKVAKEALFSSIR